MDTSARRRVADTLTDLRRRVLRRRRPLAALLAAGAVAAGLHALAPPDPPTVTVRVAGHDLPAGHVLGRGDLADVTLPAGVVPGGAVGTPEGRTLAAPLRAGEAVTDVRLVGAGLADAQPPGAVTLPVRLSDAGQAGLLTVGDRIDLVATDPRAGSARALASDAQVLALPEAGTTTDGALPGRLVVLALPAADVEEVTAASVASYVTYTWRRR
ncbi:pilus assembly protein CpaB [Nocardioides sp. W3-2-3]|uniref:SAF domain-containing protein n=1 Tax=Nocardioides convexus TaxID=2712224 RepID=UPI0024188D03|nr:SAF domain-containing protein [Nocardioides convexus]NHA00650.1 pilus assembly protein CpaB [Nocardioides convexus]